MSELHVQAMPPGWDSRFDQKTGKYYFINHNTRTTTWEDPRAKSKQVEYIPLQDYTKIGPKVVAYESPKSNEAAVAKIAATFPTVSDSHIRLLLKKYHDREALVISALQVEKHPITTPGPFATPPPPIRGLGHGASPVLRPGSAGSGDRNSPKPHSPKLKLRYMKSIFPKAEELLILDLLSGNDNNIQKVSDALKDMGFERRDSIPKAKTTAVVEKLEAPPALKVVAAQVMKTLEEKKMMVSQVREKYKEVPEPVVTIALESAQYDEGRAQDILNAMLQEEESKNEEEKKSGGESTSALQVPKSQSRQSLKSLLKSDYSLEATFSRVIELEEHDMAYRSPNVASTLGANRGLVKGANHDLLLEDYVKWHGPQPSLRDSARVSLARGTDPSLRLLGGGHSCGPNAELRKGPQRCLAKGSALAQAVCGK